MDLSELRTLAVLSNPDDGYSTTDYVGTLGWRLFLEALNARFDGQLADVVSRSFRDPSLAEQTLSDGSLVKDNVSPGLTHSGWLRLFIGGERCYRRDGHKRDQHTERTRRRAAYALHEDLFGSIEQCPDCTRARASRHNAVTPSAIANLQSDGERGRLDADYVAFPCPKRGLKSTGSRRLSCEFGDDLRCSFCSERLFQFGPSRSLSLALRAPSRTPCTHYTTHGDFCEAYIVDAACADCEACARRIDAADARRHTALQGARR